MKQEHESETRERLARLWSEAESSVQAYVFSAVSGFHHAEDVVQQVALTVARRFDEYDEARPFVAWALWLAKSRIIDHYRKQASERRVFSDVVLDQIADVMSQQQPERSSKKAALDHCVGKLPEKSRKLLELRYLEDASVESVAKRIHSTGGAVRVMLFRIREILANCIRTRLAQEARDL